MAKPSRIYVYGNIVPGSDLEFRRALDRAGGGPVQMHVNSLGGFVTPGQAMLSALEQYRGKVTAVIDAVAGSAAQLLVMAADRVLMPRGAWQFVHRGRGMAQGTASTLAAEAERMREFLEQTDQHAAEMIAKRSGKTAAQAYQWMADETWFEAAQAVEMGLADEQLGTTAAAACGDDEILASLLHVPKTLRFTSHDHLHNLQRAIEVRRIRRAKEL